MKRITNLLIMTFILTFAGSVQAADSIVEAFTKGKPYVDARYRYEFVDQNGVENEAHASTLRTRLGFKTDKIYEMMGLIEVENVTPIGNDSYNNTINGKSTYPVVADVKNTEINQVFLSYSGIEDTTLKVGRQVITVDGHRFIGHVGWRQGNQTFDGVTLTNKSVPDTILKYGYIGNVNRIFGDTPAAGDFESNSHFYNFSNTSTPVGKITTYGYILNFQNDSPANSSQSYGVSLDGEQNLTDDIMFKYHGEYAYQSDYSDNPTEYNANYYHIAPALSWNGLTVTVGYEVLGSDNGKKGFGTPLATLHKFNGWSDKFLGTPANGLEDFYVDITYKLKDLAGKFEFLNGLLAKVQYHDFNANEGGADYGNEWGLYVKKPINKNIYVETKYANYNADDLYTDTQKVTVGVGFKY